MICIFISRQHRYTIRPFLEQWPNPVARGIRLIPYDRLAQLKQVPPSYYIFSDLDRITAEQRPLAEALYALLVTRFSPALVKNDPRLALDRYRLLSLLAERGQNPYRVFRLLECPRPERFPVFIRRNLDHQGPLTQVLLDQESFLEARDRLEAAGEDLSQLLVIEYCDTCSPDGRFRKYSAFRIGDALIPGHIIFSHEWVAKDFPRAPLLAEESAYLRDNPHREAVMDIFRLARIDYGRIDYSLLGSRLVTWEINTNPYLVQAPTAYSESMMPWKRRLVARLSRALLDGHAQLRSREGEPSQLPSNG